ncbi:hypothetical protein B0H19DRAFT_80371 [Mycena capillaripes]|nr:hypothetical protein B0H19DRAFT_80371 [Mycena capillaripes]
MASPWSNSLILPLYVGAASIVTLFVHILWESSIGLNLRASVFKTTPLENEESPSVSSGHSIADHIAKHGGKEIFSFKIARLMGCLVLLGLSSAALALDEGQETTSSRLTPHKYLQAAMCGIYVLGSSLGRNS